MTCITFATLRDVPIAAARRCVSLKSKIPEGATSAKSNRARTVAICGAWKPGGGWKKATAAFTCRAKSPHSHAIFPLVLVGWSARSSPASRRKHCFSHSSPREELLWPEQKIGPRRDNFHQFLGE